jgi:uncharacterized protein (TIGR02186 family)
MRITLAIAAASILLFVPARADDLVSGLSQDQIQITSSYTGTDIVVFGAIEAADQTGQATPRDIVVVVRGPNTGMVVRRKVRIAGIWINRDAIRFGGLPSYYFLASTRPISTIASKDTLQRYQIGLNTLTPETASTRSPTKAEPFRQAAIREQERAHLYAESPDGVEFLSYSLFRARVPVPATVPTGQYTVEVYLFRDGTVISAQSTPLFVDQIGLERRLYNYAHKQPFWYGLAAVFMAMSIGWASSMVFRQA